jgi:hypothetical protein
VGAAPRNTGRLEFKGIKRKEDVGQTSGLLLVGEVEKPDPVCPFRVSGVDPEDEARYRAPSTLMESDVFFEAFANLRSR